MFARQTSAYSIARTNRDLFRTLDRGKKLKIAVKILAGNYKYVSRFFLEQQNARNSARPAAAEVVQKAQSRLNREGINRQSYEAYRAVLNASREVNRQESHSPAIPPEIMDNALQEESWGVTCGKNGSAHGLFAMRDPPSPVSEPDDQSKHFSVQDLTTNELGEDPDGPELPPDVDPERLEDSKSALDSAEVRKTDKLRDEPGPELAADIHKLAEAGDSKKDELAKRLTDLLEAVKNCPTQKGSSMPKHVALLEILKSHADTLRELVKILPAKPHKAYFLRTITSESSPETVADTFHGAYGDVLISRTTFVGFIEKTLTEFLHPALESALDAARECPTSSIDQRSLDHKHILKMFKEFFDLFSSTELWSHGNVKESLSQYYGLALSIAALDKVEFSHGDTVNIKVKLRTVAKLMADKDLKEKISDAYEEHHKIFAGFGRKKPENILFEVSKVLAGHFITGEVLNLTSKQREDLKEGIRLAKNLNDIVAVLEKAFFQVIDGKLDKQQFFQPLEDLAASRQQQ